MATPEPMDAWAWLDGGAASAGMPPELCRAAAACLGSSDGQYVMRHLRRAFLDRRLPPSASDAELRHVEGQRSAVAHLFLLAERGRAGTDPLPAVNAASGDLR